MQRAIMLLVIIFAFSACSPTENGSSEGFEKFENKEFSFEYPANWVKTEVSKLNFNVTANIKIAYVSEDTGNNVIVEVQEHGNLAPSPEFTAGIIVDRFELFGEAWGISEYKKLNYLERDYNGQKAGVLYAQYKIAQNDQLVLTAQYIIPYGRKTYVITYTMFEVIGSEDEMLEQIERIFDSFQILN